MTATALLMAVFALAILGAFGFALLTLIGPDAPLWWFERVSFSFLLGVGSGAVVWTVLMPMYGVIAARSAGALVMAGVCLVAAPKMRQRWQRRDSCSSPLVRGLSRGLAVACACVLLLQLGALMAASLHSPLGWDALFNWEIKARLAYEHRPQGQLPAAYLSDLTRAWSHPRYPLTLPFAEFWIYSWLGHIDQSTVKIVFPLFFYALVGTTCGAIRRLTNVWMALAAGIALGLMPPLAVGAGAVGGYADIPLAAAITAAGSCAILALRMSGTRMFVLAGALASVAAWTKVEGLLLSLSLGVAVALASIVMSRRAPERRVPLWAATAIVWMPVLIACPWALVQRVYGMPEADFPSLSLGIAAANLHRLPDILGLMARELMRPGHWGLLWPAFAAALVLAVCKRRLDSVDLVTAGTVVVPLFAYAVIFLFTGWSSVADHISVSIDRLLTPLAPSAFLFTVSRAWLSFT